LHFFSDIYQIKRNSRLQGGAQCRAAAAAAYSNAAAVQCMTPRFPSFLPLCGDFRVHFKHFCKISKLLIKVLFIPFFLPIKSER
jgi:hypothetical protein